ncbi:MAG: tetratricopeptide repeat protein [Actinomycetota bacterium]
MAARRITPDQRLRVFISSTLGELKEERVAVRDAVESLHLIPVMFELGARPHPPRDLYRSYLAQSHVFVGIYWERYGWIAPGEDISGLEDEYALSEGMPKLMYVKSSEDREPRLMELLQRIEVDDQASYKPFTDAEELEALVKDDLALMLTEHFEMAGGPAPTVTVPVAEKPRFALPIQPTVFVGREAEAAAVRELLADPDVRLLTLTGPGGIGKTRLAFEVAQEIQDRYADGMAYALLGQVREPSLVLPTIARAVGARESAKGSVLDALKEALGDKDILLILDNFEHVLDAGPHLAELLAACPGLTVLVTSRSALNLRSEHEFEVPPLDLHRPGHLEVGLDAPSEAVRLFVDRAKSANAAFELTEENEQIIREICARLDGLPLAIELAAARARLLTPELMLQKLHNRLELLSRGPRDLPARQQTLRALLDWDYELLDEHRRLTLRRLAVFVGGFSLAAAEQVLLEPEEMIDVLESVDSLVRKSLIRQQEALYGEPRFGMLNSIRDYALEKLTETGEEAALRDRHAEYFLELALQANARLREADQKRWLDTLEAEHGNMRVALRWLADSGQTELEMELAGNLARFWEFRGYLTEGQQRLEGALSRATSPPPELRALCLDGAGILARSQGELKRASILLEECISLRRELGDIRALAGSLKNLGTIYADRGDLATTRRLYEEALGLYRDATDDFGVAILQNNIGVLDTYEENWDDAGSLYDESLKFFRGHGDTQGVARGLMNLGEVRMMQGALEEAEDMLKESFVLFEEIGSRWDIAYVLEGMGHVVARRGRPEDAAKLYGAAESLREVLGSPLPPNEIETYEKHVARAREAMDAAAFEAAWLQGRGFDIGQALAFALGDQATSPGARS